MKVSWVFGLLAGIAVLLTSGCASEKQLRAGANLARMKTDMESDAVSKRIQADGEQANTLGFHGTPAFVVAGVAFSGARPPEYFETIIERRLKESGEQTADEKTPPAGQAKN